MAENSNKAIKNYSRYFILNLITSAQVMNVLVEKKSRIAIVLIIITYKDIMGVSYPHDDALVVTLGMGIFEVNKIVIDTESSVDIIFKDTLD